MSGIVLGIRGDVRRRKQINKKNIRWCDKLFDEN